MRRPVFTAVLATLLASASLAPHVAHAQSDADRAAARSLGQEGQDALDKKDYAAALDRFTRADKLYRAPTLMLGLARAQAGSGKLVAAYETYTRLVRDALPANASTAFKKAQDDGKKELAALEGRLPSVVINVTGPSDPNVTLDGDAVSSALLGAKRPVDPGTHKVAATADGYSPADTTFQVAEGGSATVALAMKKGDAAVAAVVPKEKAAPKDKASPNEKDAEPHAGAPSEGAKNSSQKTWGYVALGLGGVGLLAGGVTGFLAVSKKKDLDSACTNGICPDSAQDTHDSYKSLGTYSTIGFAVGIVGVAAGVTLLVTAPSEAGASAGLTVGPGSISATGRF